MGLIYQMPWTRQPQVLPRINTAHPLAASMVFCGVECGGVYIDLVSRQIADATGAFDSIIVPPSPSSMAVGAVKGRRPQSGGRLKFENQTGLDRLTTVGTILAVGYHSGVDTGAGQPILVSYETVSNYKGIKFFFDDFTQGSHDGLFILARDSGSDVSAYLTGPILETNEQNIAHVVGGAWDGTNAYFYYQSTTRSSVSLTTTPPSDTNRRTYVNEYNGSSSGTTGNVLALAFNRLLSQAEYVAWAANPWQIFAPLPRTVWSSAQASSLPVPTYRRAMPPNFWDHILDERISNSELTNSAAWW